jgi:hypothetical protein
VAAPLIAAERGRFASHFFKSVIAAYVRIARSLSIPALPAPEIVRINLARTPLPAVLLFPQARPAEEPGPRWRFDSWDIAPGRHLRKSPIIPIA